MEDLVRRGDSSLYCDAGECREEGGRVTGSYPYGGNGKSINLWKGGLGGMGRCTIFSRN